MNILLSVVAAVLMLGGVLLIPLGLPGLWLIVAVVLALTLAGWLPWAFGLTAAGAALLAEVAELLVLRRFGRAYGGSRRAFWGAVLGGTIGLFVGLPVPVVGPLLTAFLGTFAGAGVVTYWETRSVGRSARVGWGVLIARTLAVGLKVAVALGLIGAVGLALVL